MLDTATVYDRPDPLPVGSCQHDHLADLPHLSTDLCSFLRHVLRAGGGRLAYCHVGGIGDVPCMVGNALYPYLLWLHWDKEFRQFVPARLGDGDTLAVLTLADANQYLPALVPAWQAAMSRTTQQAA